MTIEPGTPVAWNDHAGVYLVVDIKPSMAQVREWGIENAPMSWTMLSELNPITEDEAVERKRMEAQR
jgi:hypothetical protein